MRFLIELQQIIKLYYFTDEKEVYKIVSNIDQYPLYAVAENLKNIANKQYTWKNISRLHSNVVKGEEFTHSIIPNIENAVPFKLKTKVKETVS